MNDTTKTLIALTESLSQVAEKQGIILELLANKLPGLSEAEKARILKSADATFASLKPLKLTLDALHK